MATNFPSSLDNSTTLPTEGAAVPLSTNHVTAHQNIQDAIEAIEAKVGIDGSAVNTSHDFKLNEVTGGDEAVGKSATQTLTNKTLTAAKVPLGSDAVGDMRYTSNADGTQTRIPVGSDNFIMKLNGTTPGWEAEAVTVDATSTTAGIVELATAAEITAGTATGGDGPLVVTPDQLAASTPVFNGSGLTNITKFLTSSGTDVVNDDNASEVTMLTYAVAGGTLSTNKGVRVRGAFTFANSSSTTSCTFRIKYGGTTLATFADPNASLTNIVGTYIFDFVLMGAGTTGTQEGTVQVVTTGASTACPIAQADLQTSSVDSTTSQNLVITSQISSAAVGRTATLKNYFIYQIV